jgi:hypothetical protein
VFAPENGWAIKSVTLLQVSEKYEDLPKKMGSPCHGDTLWLPHKVTVLLKACARQAGSVIGIAPPCHIPAG